MCGRYTIYANIEDILTAFMIEDTNVNVNYRPNYNVAPTHTVPVVINQDGTRALDGFRWGLVPFWAKDVKIGFKMINARAETVAEKPAYGRLLKSRRVIIPADGFYEWKKEGSEKQPYRFELKDKSVYGYAGLWDEWAQPDGEKLRSCTIITTTPNDLVKDVHDRMPVILPSDAVDTWLDPDNSDKEMLQSLLVPFPADQMTRYAVSKNVGNVKNSGAELVEKVELNSR